MNTVYIASIYLIIIIHMTVIKLGLNYLFDRIAFRCISGIYEGIKEQMIIPTC